MPFSFRLDSDTEAKIRRLTAMTGRSKSEVVREAVAHYSPGGGVGAASAQSAFDRLKPFIGIVRTGGANFSSETHAKYRTALRRRHRAGRSR